MIQTVYCLMSAEKAVGRTMTERPARKVPKLKETFEPERGCRYSEEEKLVERVDLSAEKRLGQLTDAVYDRMGQEQDIFLLLLLHRRR